MLSKTTANLIYEGQIKKENGSPVKVTVSKETRVDKMDNFSNNYYFERGRAMRDSLTLVVNVYNTFDIVKDGVSYSLKYVEYQGQKYTVEGIIARYMKNYKKDNMRRVLDLKVTI